jgi:plasmid stability protein
MNTDAQQYTIRNVPARVTAVLKKRARLSGRSFNQVVVDALIAATESGGRVDWLFGAHDLDDVFDDAIKQQSDVDPALWQ